MWPAGHVSVSRRGLLCLVACAVATSAALLAAAAVRAQEDRSANRTDVRGVNAIAATVTRDRSLARGSRARRADLFVAFVSRTPGVAKAGTSFELRVAVRNKGLRRARRSRTAFYLSDDRIRGRGDLRLGGPLSRRGTVALRPRRSWRAAGGVGVPRSARPGAYHLIVCADVTRRVRELSERNNCRASATRVSVPSAAPTTPAPPVTAPATGGGGSPTLPPVEECPPLPPGTPPDPGTSCGGGDLPLPPPPGGGGGGSPVPPLPP